MNAAMSSTQAAVRPISRQRERARGVSLIEVLVGITVGMIGILIVFQTFSIWNKYSQTTTSGADARIAGTLAMFNLERDLKLAGFGFAQAPTADMGCQVNVLDIPAVFPLTPVQISSAPDGTGIIDTLHGNSSFFVTTETFTASTNTTKVLTRRGGFKAGDLAVVAANGTASAASSTCALIEVTDTSNVDGVTIAHLATPYASFYAASGASAVSPTFNPADGTGTAGTFTSGNLYNLGPVPQRNRWQIVNGNLQSTDLIHNTVTQVAEGVADLQALYGVDTNGDDQISDAEWTSTQPADWTKVLAIRMGILVRSGQFEKTGDTPGNAASAVTPSWFGGPFVMRNVDGTADSNAASSPNNWRYYRYRVYDRVVPLRNMIWNQ